MNASPAAAPFTVRLRFYGGLTYFLRRPHEAGRLSRTLVEKTSIKDVIESCGVPHPEVDLILIDDASVPFECCVESEACVDIYGVPAPAELHPEVRLQRGGISSFFADGHLGKLARDLRLLGFDVLYERTATDRALVEIATAQQRALLTRDRRLLMHAAVRDGYCPRSLDPVEQTIEVLCRFGLRQSARPYTRCLECNGLVDVVAKADVIEQLQPLTRLHYERFRRCRRCGKLYWRGSHFTKLEQRIDCFLKIESP